MAQNAKKQNPGFVFVLTFFVLFVIDSLVIWLANRFFPLLVVLGNACVSKPWAVVHSMTTLALIETLAIPFVHEYENRRQKMFTAQEWLGFYFGINFIGVWLVARLAEQLGMGIRSWLVAAGLAVVLDLVQGIAMMRVERLRSK